MTRPVRLQLSRQRGFNLQAHSRAANGLDAVKVDRTTRWGNPFDFRSAADFSFLALAFNCRGDATGRQLASVKAYEQWIDPGPNRRTKSYELQIVCEAKGAKIPIGGLAKAGEAPSIEEIREHLGAHNLACWCRLCARHALTGKHFNEPCSDCAPCHTDVLGARANGFVCEAL